MSYRYDSYLVIANKFGSADSDAKAQLFETYDKLRNITVSGASGSTGGGFESAGGFLYKVASLFAPSSFMTTMGAQQSNAIPGTAYWSSSNSPSTSYSSGLENYPGFPNGAASIYSGLTNNSIGGVLSGYGTDGSATGYASDIGGLADFAAYSAGSASAYSGFGQHLVLSTAGLISGVGGIMQAAAPYMGTYGLGAVIAGNVLQGTGSAALSAFQKAETGVVNNADTILENKVRNIETVCKMLETQGDVVRKMLKESIDGDSKTIQNL
jgi:hypothetical protein